MFRLCTDFGCFDHEVPALPRFAAVWPAASICRADGSSRKVVLMPVYGYNTNLWHVFAWLVGLALVDGPADIIFVVQPIPRDRPSQLGGIDEIEWHDHHDAPHDLSKKADWEVVVGPFLDALFPDRLSPRGCYDRAVIGVQRLQGALHHGAGVNAAGRLRRRVYASAVLAKYRNMTAYGMDGMHRCLLIRRRHTRILENHEEVVSALARIFGESNVRDDAMEDLTIIEQAVLARSSTVFIGANGQGLTWTVFLPAGGRLVELSCPHYFQTLDCVAGWNANPLSEFGAFARAIGVQHACVPLWGDVSGDLDVNIERGLQARPHGHLVVVVEDILALFE